MRGMHPLDQLCTSCRVRVHVGSTNELHTHPVLLDSLEEVSGVVLGLYVSAGRPETLMSIEISDDPVTVPTHLILRFDKDMFSYDEPPEYAQKNPELARKRLEDAINVIAQTMRSVYSAVSSYKGSMRELRVEPEWEDLI